MGKKRLLWQVYPIYLLIILISLVLVTVYATSTLKGFYLGQIEQDLTARARLITDQALARLNSEDLNDLCRKLGEDSLTRITLIRPDGTVLGDSHEDPAWMDNHKDRQEIAAAIRGEKGISTRFSYTLEQEMMYVALPLKESGRVVGVVRTSLPVTAIDKTLDAVYLEIALCGLVIAGGAALLSLIFTRKIGRTLEALKQSAERFARGELEHRMEVPDSLEIGHLAEAMNLMAERLDERINTVVKQRREQEAVLSSMVEGVLAVDGEERILNLNQAAAEMLQVNPARVKGLTLQETVRNPALQEHVAASLASDTPVEGEFRLGGDKAPVVQAHGTVLHDRDGVRIGALVVLHDVTRLKQLEKIRQDFVANVSHELKTPITSIKGFIETLLQGSVKSPEEQRRFMEIVAKHTDRLNAIINDLLSLSKIEQDSEQRTVNLNEHLVAGVLKSAVQICQEGASEKGIRIRTACPDSLCARMNPPLLEQALVNLIDNALKYSGSGKEVRVEAETGDGGVVLSVSDQGQGIEEQHLPRLFERFYRVDKARSRDIGGTGLGLAIVKHIANAHGGRVVVESRVGFGSRFKIVLAPCLGAQIG